MKKIALILTCLVVSLSMKSQTYTGLFKTITGNTDYHQFVRTGFGTAVYINQASTDASFPILRLSSGTTQPNAFVKFTVENNGFVGIGTTNPEYKLDILENGPNGFRLRAGITGEDIAFSVGSPSTPDKFIIQAGGKVGIGTTTPDYKLDILETAGNGLRIKAGDQENDIAFSVGAAGPTSSDKFIIRAGGKVCIGTTTPFENYLLTVAGGIASNEVKVADITGADFVFEETYPIKNWKK